MMINYPYFYRLSTVVAIIFSFLSLEIAHSANTCPGPTVIITPSKACFTGNMVGISASGDCGEAWDYNEGACDDCGGCTFTVEPTEVGPDVGPYFVEARINGGCFAGTMIVDVVHIVERCLPDNAGAPLPGPFSEVITELQSFDIGPYEIDTPLGTFTFPQIFGVEVGITMDVSSTGDAHPATGPITGSMNANVGWPLEFSYDMTASGDAELYYHVDCDGPRCLAPEVHDTNRTTLNLALVISVGVGAGAYSTPPITIGPVVSTADVERQLCDQCQ